MNKNLFIFLICLLVYPFPAIAHNFTGMVGFFDGISHPVLGFDHFLAMISVGIVSAQIGGKAIWTVPSTFVIIMTLGGVFGFLLIIDEFFFVEVGIILSVILLGFGISIEKKNSNNVNYDFCWNFWFISWNCSWNRGSCCC